MSLFLKEVNGVARGTALAYADFPSQANNTLIGNNSGSAATPSALTATQVTAFLNTFTSSLQGLVPASGGGTINFLRADGTFTNPALAVTVLPTVQKFLSGSGTYTLPNGCLYIEVEMAGGGGGGGGSGTGSGTGGTGGTTTFGTSLLTANGGVGGGSSPTAGANGGAGGTASLGSGPIGSALTGGSGSGTPSLSLSGVGGAGGMGGDNPLGGGAGGPAQTGTGNAASSNTGAGGSGAGGGGTVATSSGAGGGGAGGYVRAIINSPSATYAYSVGAAGTAGTIGTNGQAGGAGGSGVIIVREYYANGVGNAASGGANKPTVTNLTASSGNYTTPANVLYIKVRAVGGGGGGGGAGNIGTFGSGGTGGTTTFGTSLISCIGGSGGTTGEGGGGTATLGTAIGTAVTGASGTTWTANNAIGEFLSGGTGGASVFGGNGGGEPNGAGFSASANSGSGGGGGGTNGSAVQQYALSGGGAGGYVEAIIYPTASQVFAYTIGAGGTAGTAGTGGFAGGTGGSGYIEVTEYYLNGVVGTATNVTGVVAVANGGTGLSATFVRSINTQSGTTYTFVLADGINNVTNPLVTFGSSSATTVTVPLNASVAFPIGTQIDCIQLGSGKVTFAGAGGVTVNSKAGNLSIGAQYDGVSLIKTATDTWVLMGDLQA